MTTGMRVKFGSFFLAVPIAVSRFRVAVGGNVFEGYIHMSKLFRLCLSACLLWLTASLRFGKTYAS